MAKSTLKRMPAKKRPRKAKSNTRGASALDTLLPELTGEAQAAKEAVERSGGLVTGQYLDPLGGQPLLLAVLPIEQVEPTPFQRDVSDAHHKKLADVLNRTGIFLDRDHRDHGSEKRFLDAERRPPPRRDATPRSESDHGSGRAEA